MTSLKHLLSLCAAMQDSNYWRRKSNYSGLSQVSTLSSDCLPHQNNLDLEKVTSLRKRGSVVTRRTGCRILGGPKHSFVKLYIVFSINQNIMTFYLILNETMLILEATEFSKV